MKQEFIRFENVTKSFGDNKVLDRVSFSIFKGEITSIIGKSGVGKSVLLKHIIGLLTPNSGEIRFEGRLLSQTSRKRRQVLKRKFSYMFQGGALFDSMTVFENIALPLTERKKVSHIDIKKKVRNIIKRLDLGNIEEQYPAQLSGGMKKRVALARSLITEPEIVLFDEPTTGLDPIRKADVHKMISEYQKQFGFTGVIVSHDIGGILEISDYVIMIDNAEILFKGTVREIWESTNPIVKSFIS